MNCFCTNFMEILMKTLIVFVVYFSFVINYGHAQNEEYIVLPNKLDTEVLNPFKLTCIGEIIDFSFKNIKEIFNKDLTSDDFPSDTYWEEIVFDNRLNINNLKSYIYVGRFNDNLFWSSNRDNAKLNIITGRLAANSGDLQLQASCKIKHRNWNEFGN